MAAIGRTLLPWPAGLLGAAVAVLLALGLVGDVDGPGGRLQGGLGGQRLAGDGEAALGMRAHLVQGRLVGAADLLAEGAGLGAGVDVGLACRDGQIRAGAHLVERRLAGAGHRGALGVGRLDRLVLALDAGGRNGVRPLATGR